MGYYDDASNVEQYIKMAEGYDGQLLVDVLKSHLADGKNVLELGMGPGKDFLTLSEHYHVTGSDYSTVFVERFRRQHPDADVMQLDATAMNTDRTFDCIFSNKVLHHLTREQMRESFRLQARILNTNGILLHSFWYGDKEEDYSGLRFVYYTETTLSAMIGDDFEVAEMKRYTEMDECDSFYIIVRKKA